MTTGYFRGIFEMRASMSESGLDFKRLPDFHKRGDRVVPLLVKGLKQLAESLGEALRQKVGADKAEDVAFVIKFATPAELGALRLQDFAKFNADQIKSLFDFANVESYKSNGRHLQEAALDAVAVRIQAGPKWNDSHPTLLESGMACAMAFPWERWVAIVGLAGVPRDDMKWALTDHLRLMSSERRAA